jgi:hypothetical protein
MYPDGKLLPCIPVKLCAVKSVLGLAVELAAGELVVACGPAVTAVGVAA